MSRPVRATWPAIVFLTVIVQLVLWNAYVIQRNQSLFMYNDRILVRSKSIEAVAADEPMFVVRTTYATYHRLKRFAGKTLVIPEARVPHKFALERLSRLAIEVVRDPITLPDDVMNRLMLTTNFIWELEFGSPFGVILDETAERYVLVWRRDHTFEVMVPEALYQKERAALAAGR